MPDHIHLLLTPSNTISLETAIQFIKGGYSLQRKANTPVWQESFTEHQVKDHRDYSQHIEYIHSNPVRKGLAARCENFAYSSAYPGYALDPVPGGEVVWAERRG
jgi:putative transposase